jgi:hypothetical protein
MSSTDGEAKNFRLRQQPAEAVVQYLAANQQGQGLASN